MKKTISTIILMIGFLGIVTTVLYIFVTEPWSSECLRSDSIILNTLTEFLPLFHFYAPITALLLFPFSTINRQSLFGLLLSIITLLMTFPNLVTFGC